jgi:hypothetical protein
MNNFNKGNNSVVSNKVLKFLLKYSDKIDVTTIDKGVFQYECKRSFTRRIAKSFQN